MPASGSSPPSSSNADKAGERPPIKGGPAKRTPIKRVPVQRGRAARVLRVVGRVLIGLLVLFAGLIAFIHSGPGQELLRKRIEQRLAERVVGTAKLGRLELALFGDIALGDLELVDEKGQPAVAVGELRVRPRWKELLGGRIDVERIELRGLRLNVVQDAEGGSNLRGLFKLSPPSDEPPKKRHIVIRAVEIVDGAVRLDKPGTKLDVSGIAVSGRVDITTVDRIFDVDLARVAASIALEKPASGVRLAVDGLETGVLVALNAGAGSVTLRPTSARIELARKDKAAYQADISLAETRVDIDPNRGVEAALGQLVAGLLRIDSLSVKALVADGALVGDQRVALEGLKLSADEVNALLGKELLAQDVTLGLSVAGPPERLEVATDIAAGELAVRLTGTVDASSKERPSYDLGLTVEKLKTESLLRVAPGVPRVELSSLKLGAKGAGNPREDGHVDLNLRIDDVLVRSIKVDSLEVSARIEKGNVQLTSLHLDALDQRVEASGKVSLADKTVDLGVRLDVDAGRLLGELRNAGLPIQSQLPPGAIHIQRDDLELTVKGPLEGPLDVTLDSPGIALAGGTVRLDVSAVLDRNPPQQPEKKVALRSLDADVSFAGVQVDQILAWRGKDLPVRVTTAGRVQASIDAPGAPPTVRAQLDADVRGVGSNGVAKAHVDASLAAGRANVVANVAREHATGRQTLLELDASLPVRLDGEKKGIDPGAPIRVDVEIPTTALADLTAVLPAEMRDKRKLPDGEINLGLAVRGTAYRPRGTLDGSVRIRSSTTDLVHRIALNGELTSPDGRPHVELDIDGWLDENAPRLAKINATVDLPHSPILGRPADVRYTAHVETQPLQLSDLPVAREKKPRVSGAVGATIDVQGNRKDLLASVEVRATDLYLPDEAGVTNRGPLDAVARVDVEQNQTKVDVEARLGTEPLAHLFGTVGLAGKGLLPALKEGAAKRAPVDVALDVPERPLASLSALRPKLDAAPGTLRGRISAKGEGADVDVVGGLEVVDIPLVSGEKGAARIALSAQGDAIEAAVGLGPHKSGAGSSIATTPPSALTSMPLHVSVQARRAEIVAFRAGEGPLHAHAAIVAKDADLRQLMPAQVLEGKGVEVVGTLRGGIEVDVMLDKEEGATRLVQGAADGRLALDNATVGLPNSKRAYEKIQLELEATPQALSLTRLEAHESDLAKKDRKFAITAELPWHNLRPIGATARIEAKDWLVFGTEKIGLTDAPRGELTTDIEVNGYLAHGPRRRIDVDVKHLELLIPDRFDRAHQPENINGGDIMFVGEDPAEIGRLPLAAKEEPPPPEANASETSDAPLADESAGLDVYVMLPDKAHILQSPLDLQATGGLAIFKRPGGTKLRGRIEMLGGSLSLGGKNHALRNGHIRFDDECPKGCMDLLFARPLPNTALRDVSTVSTDHAVTIHMTGPLSARKTVLGGASSPGALFDLLAVHNVGRARLLNEPDMPASNSVAFPEGLNMLTLSFLSVNLPHMLFLDRVAAWSDPYDGRTEYGQLTSYEAEDVEGQRRMRLIKRPRGPGQSEAEAQLDWLWSHPQSRTVFGVGVSGGSRAGGGPGLFLEWSSED